MKKAKTGTVVNREVKGITWLDLYAKKRPEELETYATCVIDRYMWRIEPSGKTYCAGKATKEGGKE